MKIKTYLTPFLLFSLILLNSTYQINAVEKKQPKRLHVLITNDDGIEEIKLIELARAFSKIAETTVVASMIDRSGTGNYLSVGKDQMEVKVEKRDLGPGITAYALDGYPADCVYWALRGLLKDNPPDVVVSGINGGSNLGPAWFNSGTVGAARTAAIAGFPAVAVSGLKQDIPGSVKAATEWVVKLVQTSVVRNLKKGQYLTVSIPRVAPEEIKGIKIVPRAPLTYDTLAYFTRTETDNSKPGTEVWKFNRSQKKPEPAGDIGVYSQNYIAIVPMFVYETDLKRIEELKKKLSTIPNFN